MIVFSNRQLGPSEELLLSPETAVEVLRATAAVARRRAQARWEHELVRWLDERATALELGHRDLRARVFDISDIAWTPEHFEGQRRFLIEALDAVISEHELSAAFVRWRRMIASHPRESVMVGRLWQWPENSVHAQ